MNNFDDEPAQMTRFGSFVFQQYLARFSDPDHEAYLEAKKRKLESLDDWGTVVHQLNLDDEGRRMMAKIIGVDYHSYVQFLAVTKAIYNL